MKYLALLLFLVLVTAFSRLTKQQHASAVRSDLASLVDEQTKTFSVAGVEAEVDHLDIHLSGQTDDSEGLSQLISALRGLPGGYIMNKVDLRPNFDTSPAPDLTPEPTPAPTLPTEPAPGLSPSPAPTFSPAPYIPPTPSPLPSAEPERRVVTGAGPAMPDGNPRFSIPARPDFLRPEPSLTPIPSPTTVLPPAPLDPPSPPPSRPSPRNPFVDGPGTAISPAPSPSFAPPAPAPPSPFTSPPVTAGTASPEVRRSSKALDPISLLNFSRVLGDASIRFPAGVKDVPASEGPKLERAAQAIVNYGPGVVVGLQGRIGVATSDSVSLALRRANSVKNELIRLGVPEDRLTTRQPLVAAGIEDRLDFELISQ